MEATSGRRMARGLGCVLAICLAGRAAAGEAPGIVLANRANLEVVRVVLTTGEAGESRAIPVEALPGADVTLPVATLAGVRKLRFDQGWAWVDFEITPELEALNASRLTTNGHRLVLTAATHGGSAGIAGERIDLLDDLEEATPFDARALFDADTMDAVRDLAKGGAREDGRALLAWTVIGDHPWLARVEPEAGPGRFGGTDEATTSVGPIFFRTPKGTEAMRSAMLLAGAYGYRPLALEVRAGTPLKPVQTVGYYRNAGQETDDALLSLAKTVNDTVWRATEPMVLEALLVHPDDYAAAAAGKEPDPDAAALVLRITNGGMVELRLVHDGAARIGEARQ